MQNTDIPASTSQIRDEAIKRANQSYDDEVERLRKQKDDLEMVMSEASEQETDIKYYEDRIAELDSRIFKATFIASRPYLIRWLNDTAARLHHESAIESGEKPLQNDRDLIERENRERWDLLWDMMQNEARELDGRNYEGSREEVYEKLKGFIDTSEKRDGEDDDETK